MYLNQVNAHYHSLLHAITAAFHEIKDYRKNTVDHEKAVQEHQLAGGAH